MYLLLIKVENSEDSGLEHMVQDKYKMLYIFLLKNPIYLEQNKNKAFI